MTSSNGSRVSLATNLLIAVAGAACFVVSGAVTVCVARVQGNSWFLLWILGIPLLFSWVMLLRRALLVSITVTSSSMKLRYWGGDRRIDLSELQGVILYPQSGASAKGVILDLADGSRVAIPASASETQRIVQLLRVNLPGLPMQRRSRSFTAVPLTNASS